MKTKFLTLSVLILTMLKTTSVISSERPVKPTDLPPTSPAKESLKRENDLLEETIPLFPDSNWIPIEYNDPTHSLPQPLTNTYPKRENDVYEDISPLFPGSIWTPTADEERVLMNYRYIGLPKTNQQTNHNSAASVVQQSK